MATQSTQQATEDRLVTATNGGRGDRTPFVLRFAEEVNLDAKGMSNHKTLCTTATFGFETEKKKSPSAWDRTTREKLH